MQGTQQRQPQAPTEGLGAWPAARDAGSVRRGRLTQPAQPNLIHFLRRKKEQPRRPQAAGAAGMSTAQRSCELTHPEGWIQQMGGAEGAKSSPLFFWSMQGAGTSSRRRDGC